MQKNLNQHILLFSSVQAGTTEHILPSVLKHNLTSEPAALESKISGRVLYHESFGRSTLEKLEDSVEEYFIL